MKPYDKLTIVRNRHRARDLRLFRERVEIYFEQFEYDEDNLPVDWEGVRAARSQINRMLPRIIQIVQAAHLGASTGTGTSLSPAARADEVVQNVFSARYADGGNQEILDVIDMTLGVYEASRFNALARTFNPFHYILTALGFVAGLPRQLFHSLGLLPRRPRAPGIQPEDVTRLEAVAARLADADQLIEMRFAELHERQSRQFAENAGLLADLAERLDFAERVLAQQRPIDQLKLPPENGIITPV